MAKSTPLEELQCLAFAYFAHNQYQPTEDHLQGFVDVLTTFVVVKEFEYENEKGTTVTVKTGTTMVQSVVDAVNAAASGFNMSTVHADVSTAFSLVRRKYGRYLGDGFDFERVITEFGNTITQQPNGRLNNVIYPAVKTAYAATKAFVTTPIISTDLSAYQFLDQNDDFTNTVKNRSLDRIKAVLELRGGAELLSPVDMFIVRRSEKNNILREFKEHIVDASEEQILANMSFGVTGKNTYRTITRRHFADRSLIGISLKSGKVISAPKSVKIVGTVLEHTEGERGLLDFVDPYGKLIGQMMVKNADINKLIDKAITIRFDQFVIDSNRVSWEYPIDFNYNEMVDPKTREPLYKSKLEFELLTWTDTGFNGWWRLRGNIKSPWVSGVGTGSAEQMFFRYHEYTPVMQDIISARTSVLRNLISPTSLSQKLRAPYDAALRELGERSLLRVAHCPLTRQFFALYEKEDSAVRFVDYELAVIRELTRDMKSNITSTDRKFLKGVSKSPLVDAHFIASQLAFFLFRGGKTHSLSLKKRIFLSLFGLLTKSGYKIFDGAAGKVEMSNYVRKLFTKNGKKVEAYYNAAPYVLLT